MNGNDLRTYDYASCARVALVPQDDVPIPGTIPGTIRFYRPGIDDEAVASAARAAHLHEMITQLPAGYDTLVGSGYQDLSGGSASGSVWPGHSWVRPTSSSWTSPRAPSTWIRSSSCRRRCTASGRGHPVIVAHRLSTLSDCDAVMVLEQGELVAFGTQEDVLAQNDFYRRAVELSRLPA